MTYIVLMIYFLINLHIERVNVMDKLIFLALIMGFSSFFCHIFVHFSCYLARKSGKRICACWDCKNPCELYEYNRKNPLK